MNPLESRKQLLIAESELNRAQLVQEWQAVADGVHWLQTLLKGAGLLSTVWQAFRSPGRDPDGN
jgi:hypothetical protein